MDLIKAVTTIVNVSDKIVYKSYYITAISVISLVRIDSDIKKRSGTTLISNEDQ